MLALGDVRTRDGDRLAIDQHVARRAAQHTEQCQQQFALALAVESAESDDLAGVEFQRDIVQPVRPREVTHFERRRCSTRLVRAARRKHGVVLAANHQLDDLVVCLGARGETRDAATVAEHRALVGKLGDFVHPMRDVDERQPFRTKPLQHAIDFRHVGSGQRRGGLVENQDARPAGERLGDLDHLPPR